MSITPLYSTTIISADFQPGAGTTYVGTAVAPTITNPIWNGVAPNNTNTITNFVDEGGTIVPGVDLEIRSPNNTGLIIQPDNTNPNNEPQFRNNSLLTDYVFDNTMPATDRELTLTLGGLDVTQTYNLWLYAGTAFNSELTNTLTITIDGVAQSLTYDAVAAANDQGTPGDLTDDTTDFIEGNNYLFFGGITGVTEIEALVNGASREPTLSGFQLQAVPEPSIAILGFLGGAFLLRRRR